MAFELKKGNPLKTKNNSIYYFTQKKRLIHTYINTHHYINAVSLRHALALEGPTSGSTTDTFQQKVQQN